MDTFLLILKYTGSVIAASYGVYATLTDFRVEKDGKKILTRKGYIGICVLVLSAILALSTDALKDVKENLEKQAAAVAEQKRHDETLQREMNFSDQLAEELHISRNTADGLIQALAQLRSEGEKTDRISKGLGTQLDLSHSIGSDLQNALTTLQVNTAGTRTLLNEADRQLHPISELKASVAFRVPLDDPSLKAYSDRLQSKMEHIIPFLFPRISSIPDNLDGVRVGSWTGMTLHSLSIDPNSPVLPDKNTESLAYDLIGYIVVFLEFYNEPINLNDGSPQLRFVKHPVDLGAYFAIGTKANGSNTQVTYTPSDKAIVLIGSGNPEASTWQSSGKIVSVPDLRGAQVIIRFGVTMISGDPKTDPDMKRISRQIDFNVLYLSLGNGRRFRVNRADCTVYTQPDGERLYAFQLPKTDQEVQKFLRD